jgi:hypothetical protein
MSEPISWGYWQRTKYWTETITASGTAISNIHYSAWAWTDNPSTIYTGNGYRRYTIISGSSSSGVLSCWRSEYIGFAKFACAANVLRAFDDGSTSNPYSMYCYAQELTADRASSPEDANSSLYVAASAAADTWAEWDMNGHAITYGIELFARTSTNNRYRAFAASTMQMIGNEDDAGITALLDVGGDWKNAALAAVHVGGVWKNIAAVKIAVGGTWRDLV